MAIAPGDPQRYRRQQRRRAVVGWLVGLGAFGLVVLALAVGAADQQVQESLIAVPYGDTMTSAQYEAIAEGEDQTAVLDRLGATGRPEALTAEYVLVLFPRHGADVECSYWEFSDEPAIFARLCFDREDGDLVDKRDADVHGGAPGPGDGNLV